MSDDIGKVDEILDELDLGEGKSETAPEAVEDGETLVDEDTEPEDRLSRLHEAGAITNEEYEILQAHFNSENGRDHKASEPAEAEPFGKPIATSEGTDMDFSIIGVFEDVDTTKLVLPDFADNLDQDELPSQFQGGSGRTLIFWQIYNHSNEEIKLKHKHIEQIGEDKIAYNHDGNPLQTDRFKPGWRTDNWADISADTRIKYVSQIEIPVQLVEVKIDGYCSDVHKINITDEMRFPKSELPVTIDL